MHLSAVGLARGPGIGEWRTCWAAVRRVGLQRGMDDFRPGASGVSTPAGG